MTSASGSGIPGWPKWYRYFTPSDAHRHLGLYPVGVGRKSGAVRPIDARTLPCHGAIFVVEGEGWFESPRVPATQHVVGPAVLWLFPGVAHSYGPYDPGWAEQWVLFGGTAPRSYEQLGYLSPEQPVQRLTAPSIRDTFDQLIERCSGSFPHGATEATMIMHRLIVDAGRQRGDGGPSTASHPLVERLRDHACLPLTVAEHARRLGVSVPTLRAAVRAAGLGGPKELVQQERITHAMSLLAESAMPVRSVAREVGYHDPAYFTRLFTQRVGTSPGRFRRQHRAVPVHVPTPATEPISLLPRRGH